MNFDHEKSRRGNDVYYSQCIVRKGICNQSLVVGSSNTCTREKGKQKRREASKLEGTPVVIPAEEEAGAHNSNCSDENKCCARQAFRKGVSSLR